MSYTPVQHRFWSDGWVRQLNALDRYLFLYLLTNERINIAGIYELPLDIMAAECGIDEKDLRLSMLSRLEPKVYYREGWVIVLNYIKHRVSNSPKYLKGIQVAFNGLPKPIQEIAKGYGYPIDTISHIDIDIDKIKYSGAPAPQTIKEVKVNSREEERETPERISSNRRAAYESMLSWAEKERGSRFVNRIKQYKALARAKSVGLGSIALKERWLQLAEDKFFAERGFDWTNVVNSFDRKGV